MELGKLIETIPGQEYSRVHSRCLTNEGCIVDLGSLRWDWSEFFIGKKRIVGVDPFDEEIPGVEYFKGVVSTFDGTLSMAGGGTGASIFNPGNQIVASRTWKTFCKDFNIDRVSVLKINIEGAEYGLLKSMDELDFAKIDQIAVSFHDFLKPEWQFETQNAIKLLEGFGYEVTNIHKEWRWYLAMK